MDTFPPQKNKLKIEQMASLLLNPFHGYKGLYLDHESEPSYPSSEPIMFANRKSVGNPSIDSISLLHFRLILPIIIIFVIINDFCCAFTDINIRRISRPLSVQPKQIETLNELFLSVIRRHGQKHHL
jgi:hypothetical protein